MLGKLSHDNKNLSKTQIASRLESISSDDSSSEEEEQTLEEKIEEERANLISSECTPVTLETFNKWKADKAARKIAELEERAA